MEPTQTDLFHSFLAALTVIAVLFSVFAISLFYHLRKKQNQLRDKLFQDECFIEADKARIAKDLHDDLGSLLTGLQLSFSMLAEKEPTNVLLQSSTQQISASIQRLREIALNLLPRELETEGLNAAIESFIERIHATKRITILYTPISAIDQIDKQKAMVLFRIIQEILTNAIKHSRAPLVEMGIAIRHRTIVLEFKDHGIGFDYASCLRQKHCSGLKNIQSRIDLLNGTLFVTSIVGKGTHYTIEIPYRPLTHAHHS